MGVLPALHLGLVAGLVMRAAIAGRAGVTALIFVRGLPALHLRFMAGLIVGTAISLRVCPTLIRMRVLSAFDLRFMTGLVVLGAVCHRGSLSLGV